MCFFNSFEHNHWSLNGMLCVYSCVRHSIHSAFCGSGCCNHSSVWRIVELYLTFMCFACVYLYFEVIYSNHMSFHWENNIQFFWIVCIVVFGRCQHKLLSKSNNNSVKHYSSIHHNNDNMIKLMYEAKVPKKNKHSNEQEWKRVMFCEMVNKLPNILSSKNNLKSKENIVLRISQNDAR